MEPGIVEKVIVIFALVFWVYLSQLCGSLKKRNIFELVD